MLGAIQMPTWLVDFWAVYGDMITPVLVTLVTALLTALSFKIKSDAKINAEKADLQLQALKEVANREDNKPELEALKSEVTELKSEIKCLCEMNNLAYQNSTLDPEIKSNLSAINNKCLYGTEDNLISVLTTEKEQLAEQVKQLEEKLAEAQPKVTVIKEEVKKRVRR